MGSALGPEEFWYGLVSSQSTLDFVSIKFVRRHIISSKSGPKNEQCLETVTQALLMT